MFAKDDKPCVTFLVHFDLYVHGEVGAGDVDLVVNQGLLATLSQSLQSILNVDANFGLR